MFLMSISENVTQLRDTIHKLHGNKGIPFPTIVAVTKYSSISDIQTLIGLGFNELGESRIQDAEKKIYALPRNGLIWHLIGHLQSNKVKKAVDLFDWIQSVDSLALLSRIDQECGYIRKQAQILLQVNLSREPQKFGFLKEEIEAVHTQLFSFPNVTIRGIMTMGPLSEDKEKIRKCFQEANTLFLWLRSRYPRHVTVLSMGMSEDYLLALEEGATMIRVGHAFYLNSHHG